MSLVSYDESSGSGSESESENENNAASGANDDVEVPAPDSGLFKVLPQPKVNENVVEEEQDEFLEKKPVAVEQPKKIKQPVKIGVPSLKEYEDDDDDDGALVNKPKVSKASGLFSILPPPKGVPLSNKSFIPNVLMKPKPAAPKVKKPAPKIPPKYLKEAKEEAANESDDGDDLELPETFDDETWEKVCGRKKPVATKRTIAERENPITDQIELAPEPVEPYSGLDNTAFKELVGSHKRRKENIKLIDINEEDILPEKEQWLVKSLTDPNYEPKTTVEDPVNDTCRRKHHITYLAQQAKANEQELQTQWSQNKFTRKQTQSKYGF